MRSAKHPVGAVDSAVAGAQVFTHTRTQAEPTVLVDS